MKADIENLQVRAVIDADYPFIYNSWLKSAKHGPFWGVSSEVYYASLKILIAKLLVDCDILIAHKASDVNYIVGYIVYKRSESGIFNLQYVYVKHQFRNFGIATALFTSSGYDKNKDSGFAGFAPKKLDFGFYKKLNLLYNPFINMISIEKEEK